jgi:L-fuculose-phosphate aldolase
MSTFTLSGHDAIRLDVIAGVRRLVAERLVIGTTGNVSARAGDRVVITPTRTSYAGMRPEDLVEVERSARRAVGASRELPLHLAAYAARPDVFAVVHTHSPHATAWSFLGSALEPEVEDLTYYAVGPVLTCAGEPGSTGLAASAAAALAGSNGVLLAGHGVVTVADTVELAVHRAAAIEHAAQVALLVRGAR